jgi:hypothetical protein
MKLYFIVHNAVEEIVEVMPNTFTGDYYGETLSLFDCCF